MRRYVELSLLALVASCSFTPGVLSDSDGSVDVLEQVCNPAAADTCKDAMTLTACRPDGSGYDDVACSSGCSTSPEAHCVGIVPSNGIPVATLTDADGNIDTATTGSLRVDSDSGLIVSGSTTIRAAGLGYDETSKIAFSVVAQTDAPSIGVFAFASLRVGTGTIVRVSGGNAVAFVAQGTIAIDGTIDVTGGHEACVSTELADLAQCAGPGGIAGGAPNTAATGSGAGGLGSGGLSGYAESGGGGGGHGSIGASGGAGTTDNTTVGTPGPVFGSESLSPLTGGGGGGGGGNEPQQGTTGASGGGGGGAVQIVSATAIVFGGSASCGVNAGGGGAGTSQFSAAGGGGGAGGGILLEAPTVALVAACVLAANGGGGSGASVAMRGTTGLLDDGPAAGSIEGSGGTRNSGDGGAGAALGSGAVAGESRSDEAGGGGAGVGYIHVKSTDGSSFTADGTISPAATQSAITLQ